jgi:3-methyl-2-oxobutanoate hydroxymethyltransferase
MKKTIAFLLTKKKNHVPITMLTAYDFPTARIEDEAGIDVVLVGDSVGTNVLGYLSERDVTMDDMLHHTAAVVRGVQQAFVLVDLPYLAAETAESAYGNALRLFEKGAQCVKIEGWQEKCPVIDFLSKNNIPVCAHIGYNPQIHGPKPRLFGKTAAEAFELLQNGRMLQNAGAQLIVVEKVTEEAAGVIALDLAIPVIGIGSGNRCDGQVLVINDLLGVTVRSFKHVRRYAEVRDSTRQAVCTYVADVEARQFPAREHAVAMDAGEAQLLKEKAEGKSAIQG